MLTKKGLVEGKAILIIKMINKGKTIEEISEMIDMSIEEIKKLINK